MAHIAPTYSALRPCTPEAVVMGRYVADRIMARAVCVGTASTGVWPTAPTDRVVRWAVTVANTAECAVMADAEETVGVVRGVADGVKARAVGVIGTA